MTGLRIVLILLLACVGAILTKGVSAEPVMITDDASVDLSDQVEWCESPADVAAIAAGGCHFVPATPSALTRGYSPRTYWLRLELINPTAQPVERWLHIGHPRLEEVSFFEATTEGGWRRSDSGLAIPPVQRAMRFADPLLSLTLAPGERRLILVREASRTLIDLTPTLWRPNAYVGTDVRTAVLHAVNVGALLVVAMFTLMVYLTWRDPAYLCFSGGEIARALFTACYSGLLPTYLWPEERPFDISIQAVAAGASVVLYVLFVRRCIGGRYRRHQAVLLVLAGLIALAMGGACLADYATAIRVIMLTSLVTSMVAISLFWRAWRDKIRPAGFLLAAAIICLLCQLSIFIPHSNALSIVYAWGFLLSSPAALLSIVAHKEEKREEMQRHLLTAQAESAARLEFLAHMSHELRTPLDTVLGTTQLLARSIRQPQHAEKLARILESGRHLLRMIDEILDHARGSVGKLKLRVEPVDWGRFLRGTEYNARILAARNGNTFSLHAGGVPIAGAQLDESRLRQVLDNLLSNAARHTKDGSIRLDCVAERLGSQGRLQLSFAVTDSGEGIPLADQERIFRPFERGQQATRRGGKGVGMGLTIARQLVELMGGRLTVQSRPGKGACFCFQVMADEDGAPGMAPRDDYAGYGGPRRTILLVDDEDDSRPILAALLKDCGFDVIEANSGQAVVAMGAVPLAVDLVLTDQFMADGDGWMVLRHMGELNPDVPVVLISAAPPERPDGFPQRMNFAEHLLKPLDHVTLLRCLGELLGLEWVDSAPSATLVEDAPGACPDDVERERLRAMIMGGRISEMMAWAETLKVETPRYAAWADKVHAAADQLDFPALKDLARP
ncbi:MAG: ATP-binding protein [Bacteroidota bacterium]